MQTAPENKDKGFTLMEVLIVVALLGVFSAVATDTFTNIIRMQNKTRVANELEQSGNYILSIMEQEIRNSEKVLLPADGSSTNCIIYESEGEVRGFRRSGSQNIQQGRNCVQQGGCSCTSWRDLLDRNVIANNFLVGRRDSRIKINLSLRQAASAPARKDFQGSINLETTVVVRGSYE